MLQKIKMVVDVFGKITTGILIASAIFVTVFWGTEANVNIGILWQILMVSAACSLGILFFPSNEEREISKTGMFMCQTIYFLYINVVVLGLGSHFEWFSFSNWRMVLFMEVLIIGVYVLVNLVSYLNDYLVAKSMNARLSKKRI